MQIKLTFENREQVIRNLPTGSGIYYFFEDNKLLYVGKAKRLRYRVWIHYHHNKTFPLWYKILERGIFTMEISPEIVINNINLANLVLTAEDYFTTNQRIDLAFHRVTTIRIEEIPHDLTKEKERKLIYSLNPPLNYQTRIYDPVDDLIEKGCELRHLILKNGWYGHLVPNGHARNSGW